MKRSHRAKGVIFVILLGAFFALGVYVFVTKSMDTVKNDMLPSVTSPDTKDKPLSKYAVSNLRRATFLPSTITLGEKVLLNQATSSYMFYFSDSFASDKRISGTITLPQQPGTYPVILMLRGWADEEIYYPGYGTKNAAAYFARQGYITIAPDFLGYGESDPYAESPIEARFQTYTAAITLYKSLENVNEAFHSKKLKYQLDASKVGIWAHSNGGQVTLALLTVTGESVPSTLWAPVTIPFPENIVHYSSDQDDRGAMIKSLVSDFRNDYVAKDFTPTQYLSDITAPIILHQGSADDSVPQKWNDDFVETMTKLDKDITYYRYQGADHNMRPVWATVISRDVRFFDEKLNSSQN